MHGRGACCIARYAVGSGPYDLSKADRIMLRFRPIAPKPTTDGDRKPVSSRDSGGSGGSSDFSFRAGRGKRKCHQQKDNDGNYTKRCTRQRRSEKSVRTVTHGGANAVTLSLLLEKPVMEKQKRNGHLWLSFSDGGGMLTPAYHTAEVIKRTVVISSSMTVERVTDAWIDGYGLGKSDEERKMNLMRDTCPGFISDGSGRVTWTNDAYRKMARDNIPVDEGVPEITSNDNIHVIVQLVMKERPMLSSPGFTCRVKIQYMFQNRGRGSVTVPCDVWRMDGGGFVWRLDVKAALCL